MLIRWSNFSANINIKRAEQHIYTIFISNYNKKNTHLNIFGTKRHSHAYYYNICFNHTKFQKHNKSKNETYLINGYLKDICLKLDIISLIF